MFREECIMNVNNLYHDFSIIIKSKVTFYFVKSKSSNTK
jgi:hypothetical protein